MIREALPPTLLTLNFGRYLERRNNILAQLNDDQHREKDPKSIRYSQRSPKFIKNELNVPIG